MTKEEIAGVLEQIATLLELKNENPFKIRAYTNAARAIETFGGNVTDFQDEEALSKIPGIGKSIALKIKELAAAGSLKYLEELSAEFPSEILELFSLPGLGAKKIKALYDKLQISSIAQLQKACETGRVAELPGFGKTTQQKLCDIIAKRAAHAGSFQFGQIAVEAETLRSDLAAAWERFAGRSGWELSAEKRNRARFGSLGGDKETREHHEILRFPSACGIDYRARAHQIERAIAIGSAV